MIWYDPVADKLEDEDEEPSVEREHSDLSPKLLHDDRNLSSSLVFLASKIHVSLVTFLWSVLAVHISNHPDAALMLCPENY